MSDKFASEKVTYNICQGYGCHEHCILKTFVVNGKIQRTERTVFPDIEGDWIGICQKGITAGKIPYLPNRILYPMKRVGERGEGKFERVSWDQALDEIGAKLNEIKQVYGSEAVGVFNFPCGVPPVFGLFNPLTTRFMNTFGASNLSINVDSASFFSGQIDFGSCLAYGQQDPRPLANSKYIILWGVEPVTTRPAWRTRLLVEAQEKGAKVVRIGLTYDPTSAKADWFIPIRPGSDAALALAMANAMVKENLYDEAYLAKKTVAPFLVREDTGKFLRESEIVDSGDPAKYVVWSKVGTPIPVAARTFELAENMEPDLQAVVTIQGISCKTAFVKLKEHLAVYTPEYQEQITGIPAAIVTQLLHEYMEASPATIFYDWGGAGRYLNGQRSHRAINLIAALAGRLGKCQLIIASVGYGWPVQLNDAPISFPDGIEGAKGHYQPPIDWHSAILTGVPHPIRAMMIVAGNPIHALPNRQLWEEMFQKLDLVVDYDIRMTDTGLWADYVLPDLTIFEKYELPNPVDYNHIILNEPAIDPIGEGKPPADLYRELAKRVGLEKYFDKSTEEWIDIWLQSKQPAIAELQPPLNFKRLKEEKMVRANVPADPFDPIDVLGFFTPSGRMEFYCEDFAPINEAIARYVAPIVDGPKRKGFPLQFYTGRSRFFMQTQFTDIPELATLAGGEPTLRMNPKDASARGIRSGDIAQVCNDIGICKAKVLLSETMPPGTVHLWYGWRHQNYIQGAHNVLLHPLGTPETEDTLRTAWGNLARARYSFIPLVANWEIIMSSNWDPFWDNYCEVQKA
jgi:molybdopterin-containing oxidoreductase family molybdopterin binding subunit